MCPVVVSNDLEVRACGRPTMIDARAPQVTNVLSFVDTGFFNRARQCPSKNFPIISFSWNLVLNLDGIHIEAQWPPDGIQMPGMGLHGFKSEGFDEKSLFGTRAYCWMPQAEQALPGIAL